MYSSGGIVLAIEEKYELSFFILIDMNFLPQMINCYYIRSENISSNFWFHC